MHKTLAFSLLLAVGLASPANAVCFGSGAFATCSDDSGNTYKIQRFGNQTFLQGSNAGTGSTWWEHSMTLGNSTYIDGRAANGNSWNETINHFGPTTTYSGTDSQGNSFSSTCGPLGCTGTHDYGLNYGQQPQALPDDQEDQSLGNNDDDDDQSLGSNDDDESLSDNDGN